MGLRPLAANFADVADAYDRPVFARVYAKVAEIAEGRGGAEHRRRLLDGLRGRVIEVGAGSGTNFAPVPRRAVGDPEWR